MRNLTNKLSLVVLGAGIMLVTGCNPPVYVTQSRQSFHDYTAVNHNKVVNKTKKPKSKTQRKNRW